MQNVEHIVFQDEILSDDTDLVERVVSKSIPVEANTVRLSITVTNLSSSGRIHFVVEGSYDRTSWWTTGLSARSILSVSASPASQASASAVATDYAWLRVRAYVTGGPGVFAIFSTVLNFAHL